jgi:16S rRNA (cytosine967-C5)-methyltransferase
MKYDNQLRYAANIIRAYDGLVPLSSWLKDFFKQHKQMGSRDRKTVSSMVYGYYRLGHTHFESVEERILASVSLLNTLSEMKEYFNIPPPSIKKQDIFPWAGHLSETVDPDKFTDSFLVQPDLFLRIRPGHETTLVTKLKDAGIDFELINEHTVSLPNSTKLEGIIEMNSEAVVQDLNSQQTASLFPLAGPHIKKVWDCCAASGGKSIMAYDIIKEIDLTVSDKRKVIIDQLELRFEQAGIHGYHSFVADLTKLNSVLPSSHFDLVIADVPCSGSGTWSRTPEQLYFFEEARIAYYKELQQTILTRVLSTMQSPSALLYITCSVFKEENEEMVDFILSTSELKLKKMQLFKGYENKADTMFAAMLTI